MKKRNILILDDQAIILETLGYILKEAGYNIFLAKSVFRAEMILLNNDIDLLLSDVNVGDDYGFDLADTATATDPFLPVVMMTADTSGDSENKAEERGYGFFSKPIDVFELRLVISKMLRTASDDVSDDFIHDYQHVYGLAI